jgi:ribonucleoside-diphosphate reductase alpha chain
VEDIEPVLTANALTVLNKRYLIKDATGAVVETPKQLFRRVAERIASVEDDDAGRNASEVVFYRMMARRDFMPNTPCLVNAGRPDGTGHLNACFVVPIEDDMGQIFEALRRAALIFKGGGGVGYSFSRIRPEDDFVHSSMGIASGPISFMKIFDYATEQIKQGGVRRGANMGILRCDHPDLMKFIELKSSDSSAMQNFNISVAITNEFMKALEENRDYDIVHPRTGEVCGKFNAPKVWKAITEHAWKIGDPGLWFIDRTNERDPLTELGLCEATNPCGEVPLRPLDACCLGSINLANFVDAIGRATPIVESTRLRITVRNAVRFLDNMLLASEYPLPEIADVTSKSRKIGLGVMGFAEMLIMLGIPYGSQAGRDFAKKLMADINGWAVQASEDLAIERGAFFHWDKSTYAKRGDKKRRNSTVTVIAPTGTISIIAGCSGGIEPLFALAITRNQAGTQMPEFNPLVEQIARREGFWQYEVSAAIADTGSIQGCAAVPEHWRNILRVASELTMEEHIGMQAAFQAHTEDGASKTINLRRDATVEDVDRAYRLAWASGCKGITVYRDGCRDKQVLTAGVAKPEASKPIAVEPAVFESFVPPIDKTLIGVQAPKWPTPSVTHRRVPSDGWRDGSTCTKPTSFGSVHVTINEHPSDAQPFEIFVRIGKGGSEIGAWTEALGRTGSFMLQLPSGSSPRDRLRKLGEQLADIGGGEVIGRGETKIVSAPDAISKIIYEYLQRTAPKAVAPDAKAETSSTIRRDFCPQCHKASLVRDGGCPYCPECSYSKC